MSDITPHDIRAWRIAAGLTVREAGERTTFGHVSIGRLERGDELLRQGVIEQLRSAYGVKHCLTRGWGGSGVQGLHESLRRRLVEQGRSDLAEKLKGGGA